MATLPLASFQRCSPSTLARSILTLVPSRNLPPIWNIYRTRLRVACSANPPGESYSSEVSPPDGPPEAALPAGLYVVATPIGCLEDITLRAIRVLRTADKVLCEDTRRTGMLLHHLGIKNHLESYHLHNENQKLMKASKLYCFYYMILFVRNLLTSFMAILWLLLLII